MKVEDFYDRALAHMERTVNDLAQRVIQPQQVPYKDSFHYRYLERNAHQAVVQKLARLVSGLHAVRLLMINGFVQEQAVLQRVLDELEEDITFLTFGIIFNQWTALHQTYLDAFFEEEFDADSAIESTQKRPMVPRKKIRAWIASLDGAGMDSSRNVELARTISKTYSGYVHAASPQIMDMYFGYPPRFWVRGMIGTPRHDEFRADLWNYFYRGVIAFGFAAMAFGDEALFTTIRDFSDKFHQLTGKNYESSEWDEGS